MDSLKNIQTRQPVSFNVRAVRPRLAENKTLLYITIAITALLPIWRSLWILPQMPVWTYYASFGLLTAFALISGKSRIHWSMVWLLCWCAASIMLNTFSTYFTPWPRLIGLALIIIGAGPMLANYRLLTWRRKALSTLMWGFVAVSVASFILYYIVRPFSMYRGFLFIGITSNSMILSPIASIAALFLIQWYMRRRHKLTAVRKVLVWTVWVMCMFAAILAGSRASMISFMVAFVIWLWFYLRSAAKMAKVMVIVTIFLIISSPAWMSYTETIEKKMEASQEAGGMLSTRESLWEQRWKEFTGTPVFGIGFSKVDKMTDDTDTRNLTKGGGVVEPGNGWLFVLSSTGIGAFVFLLWMYITQLWKLIRVRTYESLLTLSLLVFLGVHSFAEGYLFSSGNIFCLLFWLVLGLSVSLPRPAPKLREAI